MPSTTDASEALCLGTKTPRMPCSFANNAAAKIPGTDRSDPSKPSSPNNNRPSMAVCGKTPSASNTPTAIGRSNADPRFF